MEAVLLCSIHEASEAVYQPRICAIASRAELLTVDGFCPSAKLIVFAPPATVALPVAVWLHLRRLVVICFYSPIGLMNPAMLNFLKQAMWRVYQIALGFVAMLIWGASVPEIRDYWFWQIMAMFVFVFFFGYFGTILTGKIIDRIAVNLQLSDSKEVSR